MSEYIDADFAVVCDEWQPTVTSGEEQEYIKKEDAENIMLGSCDESALWKLRYLPSADVVEVVRCKNCRHNGSFDTDCPFGWRDERFNLPDDIDFCSYGER